MTPEEYLASRPRLSHASYQRLRTSVSRWRRITGHTVAQATTERLTAFRAEGLALGLSPYSVEQTATDVAILAGIPRGQPLELPPPDPDVPSVERIDAIYRHVSAAQWPVVTREQGGHWMFVAKVLDRAMVAIVDRRGGMVGPEAWRSRQAHRRGRGSPAVQGTQDGKTPATPTSPVCHASRASTRRRERAAVSEPVTTPTETRTQTNCECGGRQVRFAAWVSSLRRMGFVASPSRVGA